MDTVAKKIEIFGEKDIGKALEKIDNLFHYIDVNVNIGPENISVVRHEIIGLIHEMISLIHRAEKEGWSTEDIEKKLPLTVEIHSKASFPSYLQRWPRGYPGDFVVVNMIMDRKEEASPYSVAGIVGRYAIDCNIAQQHREKIQIQTGIVKEACREIESPNIFSIACGSSRDLEGIQGDIKDSNAKVFLLDSDEGAIEDSCNRLVNIKSQLKTYKMNVLRAPSIIKRIIKEYGKLDRVYMGGLLDYLEDKYIDSIFGNLPEDFMNEGGKLMLTNIAKGNSYRTWIETLVNWVLIERSQEDMKRIASMLNCKKVDLFKEPMDLTWILIAHY